MSEPLFISLKFPFEAVSKGRPRLGKFETFTPNKTREFEAKIGWFARTQYRGSLIEGPCRVEILFNMKRPKSARKNDFWAIGRSDLDNLIKSVLDGLNGIIWADDRQVVAINAAKVLVVNPSIEVKVWKL